MTIDGFNMLSTGDNFIYHEMMSHVPLFTHPNPENVVIIGGGDCGVLHEVLKHNAVKSVRQIDIDERVTRLAGQYFPELCASNHDPRAQLRFEDGVKWMLNAEPESIDVIIIDSTDPIGPGEGLFTPAFYQSCYRALRDGGVLIQQSGSPLYHRELIMTPMNDALITGDFSHTSSITYPVLVYPSGWWSSTLGGKGVNVRQFRREDSANKGFETQYYNSDIHGGALAQPEFMK